MFFFSDIDNYEFKPRSVEQAYYSILKDDLKTAQAIFESLDSPRARWGKSLIDILLGYIEKYPTYFEIRNFLEIDLDFLIKNEKIDYVEMILGSLDILAGINQEIYKYIARVMFENKLYNVSLKYLDKSRDMFYNDPELHFLYAKYYINSRDYNKAYEHICECQKILPEYYPTKLLKEEISKFIAIN